MAGARAYEVRVSGHLDDRWSAWFAGLTIARLDDGTSTLTGSVVDQAQLHGILARLRDIGATLLSLSVVVDEEQRLNGPAADPTHDRDERPRVGC